MNLFFKEDWKLLKDGGRNLLLFEILYKMIAVAGAYPLAILLIDFALKVAGVRYLTNGYIIKVITNPMVVIVLVCSFLIVGAYLLYEMVFISACFEFKRNGFVVSMYENLMTSAKTFSRITSRKNWFMAPFTVISVLAINISGILNIIITSAGKNMVLPFLLKQKWYVWIILTITLIVLYVSVLMGSFVMNVFILDDKSFTESYKKSARIVKRNFFRIAGLVILYNMAVIMCVGIVYVFLSAAIVAGVKVLDMAYIGSAVFLSSIRVIRVGINVVILLVSVPASYTMLSRAYYRYDDDPNMLAPIRLVEKHPLINVVACMIIFFCAMLLNTSYVVSAFNRNPFDKVAILSDIKVSAHRGSSKEAPENTMAAFKKAIEDRADFIELDVQETSDGHIIVMHDSNVLRTTGVDRNVWEMTFLDIRNLDAGSYFSPEFAGEQVPSLEEVLKLAKGKIKLNIEIKPSGHDKDLTKILSEMIDEYNFEKDCVITSYDYTSLREIKKINPDIQVGYIVALAYGDFYNMDDIDFFSMNASFLSKITVDTIHNSGKEVYAWTVNNPDSVKNLANKGVDNIITDDPVTAQEVIYSRNTSETVVNMIKYVFSK